MNPLSLEGKVAVITGGASGIGLATAHVLGAHGAKVAILDLSDRLDLAYSELKEKGVCCLPIRTDISKGDDVKAAIEKVAAEFGRIDILHANAGINGVWAPIEQIVDEEFEHTFAVNVGGTFIAIKYATPYLKETQGSVVITSSVNGTRNFSNSGASVYSATKAAQIALMKMLAVELGQSGIRVNAICPGYIPSNIHESTIHRNQDTVRIPISFPNGAKPLKHKGTGEDIANVVLFLSSDLAAHITGEEIFVDAGASLVLG